MLKQNVTVGTIVNDFREDLKRAMENRFSVRVQFEQSIQAGDISYVVVPEVRRKERRLEMENFLSGFGAAKDPKRTEQPGGWRRV